LAIDSLQHGATTDQFWAVVQRLLAFDEPVRTSAQIRKILSKSRKPGEQSTTFSLSEQLASAFATTGVDRITNRLFTALFSQRMAQKIRDIAWDVWAAKQHGLTELADLDDFELEFVRFACAKGLCDSALKWCLALLRANLPWHTLKSKGPWVGDSRAATIRSLLSSFERVSLDSFSQLFLQCDSIFSQSVQTHRADLPGNFLPAGILLVEGTTEMILFPHIASRLGARLESCGLMLLAAGGANQVCKRFMQLKEVVAVPIACVLDADAVEQSEMIGDGLRERDQLHVLKVGEVEDTFSVSLFTDLLNQYLHGSLASAASINVEEFARHASGKRNTQAAHKLLRQRASIDFNKVEFAKLAVQRIRSERDIPEELRYIVRAIVDGLSGAADVR